MCNRIKAAFEALEVKGEKAFIGYLTAGDPDLNKTEAFVYALEKGGANIIELGIPFFQIHWQMDLQFKKQGNGPWLQVLP